MMLDTLRREDYINWLPQALEPSPTIFWLSCYIAMPNFNIWRVLSDDILYVIGMQVHHSNRTTMSQSIQECVFNIWHILSLSLENKLAEQAFSVQFLTLHYRWNGWERPQSVQAHPQLSLAGAAYVIQLPVQTSLLNDNVNSCYTCPASSGVRKSESTHVSSWICNHPKHCPELSFVFSGP